MGKPIVVSDFPELKEKVEKYKLGYVFNPNSHKDIAIAINKVFSTEYIIKKKNFADFLHVYNWKNEKKKLMNVYKLFDEIF